MSWLSFLNPIRVARDSFEALSQPGIMVPSLHDDPDFLLPAPAWRHESATLGVEPPPVSSVPEPAESVLMLAGLLVVIGARMLRRCAR